jgi:hypothetical protein
MTDQERLRGWWWHRQGLDGSLRGRSPEAVLERCGWARSVGGAGPYLTLFARSGTSREEADAAVAAQRIHELPAARGCTYVLPARDFALGLRVGRDFADAELRTAEKLGVTEQEIDTLGEAVFGALGDAPMEPDALRDATAGRWRSLGDEGRKKGISTTLPIALGRLQARGRIRRVPINGRLDQQRYAYARWAPSPADSLTLSDAEVRTEVARRFFRWVGPATLGELRWFTALGAKVVKEAVEPLGLEPVAGHPDRFILPQDAAAWREFEPIAKPQYALVSSLDPISATRRDLQSLLEDADRERAVVTDSGERPMGGLSDLPAHAIMDRGRVIGLWEFDPEAGEIAWMTFSPNSDHALEEAIEETQAFVRDQLGDARSFSLDSPKSRKPRLEALRGMRR